MLENEMFDVLITGGKIIDGSGGESFSSDVGINGDVISEIGDLSNAEAVRKIDASGLIVSPGLIDTHAHSDGALLNDPQHANGLRQGITTEILGQDGLSYAPLSRENYLMNKRYLAGLLGDPPNDLDMSSVKSFRSHYHKKVAINTAYPIPHCAVRLETLGFTDSKLEGKNLDQARQIIAEGMEQGAIGLSTGMSYFPNAWSTTEELISLCEIVAEYGGVYITHLRDVNTDRAFGGGGVTEALEIGRRSGVKVHFSHYRTDPKSAGRVKERIAEIDAAKSEGVDCTLELYPYPTGSSYPVCFLPSSAHEGGPEVVLQNLKDPKIRKELISHVESEPRRTISDAVFTYMPNTRDLEGMSLVDIANSMSMSNGEALVHLLIENDLQVGYRHAPPDSVKLWDQVSQDCLEFLSRDDYMVGSDSIPLGSFPHPRAYGTFPRLLGRLRRSFDVLSLETMIQRMTDNPAKRFGLTKRGRVQKDYFADLFIFDEDHINDNATYDDPRQFPMGIPYVLVNGEIAVDNENCTGVIAGHAIP